MADLNALIAQGYQFQPLPDPFVQYGKRQQLEQGEQANQLNQMKLQEAQAAAVERNALRQLNPTSPDYETQLFRLNPTLGIAYRKEAAAAAASKATQERQTVDTAVARKGMLSQAFRDISSRPSDANITAHLEDVKESSYFTANEVSRVEKLSQILLAMPFADRGPVLASQGATANDLSTAATAAAGQAVTARGQDIGATTAAAGQAVTARGQDIGAATATRGQDIGASTAAAGQAVTARGQDIGATTAREGQAVTARGQDIGASTAAAGQAVTARGQDIGASTAAAGQAVTARGQDVGAATAKAGQAVTMRGQNLVDARAQENLLVRKEDQRRAADPAFQQQLAEAKSMGQNMAKDKVLRATQLPKVLDTAAQTLAEVDTLIGKRDKDGKLLPGEKPHPGFENAVGATFLPGARFVPGTDAANFQARFDQIKGGAFLQAFETLKGGGSITNIEGEKGTAALNRMSLAQSEKEFVQASREFQDIVRTGVARAKKIASESSAGGEWKVVK